MMYHGVPIPLYRNSMASEDSNNFFGSKRSLLPTYKKKSKFEVLEAKNTPNSIRIVERPAPNVNFAPFRKSLSPSGRIIEVSKVALDPMKENKDNCQAQSSSSITFTLPNDLDA
uniref:Uncharacterized protein n=1 Tax=Romanomermis culicivorax TaxID=13658 RepID=A0A915K585_ROMCU